MSEENNIQKSEKDTKDSNPFLKGWQNFIDGVKVGYNDFKTSLEEQTKKNQELWDENKDNVKKFLNKVKADWESKINEWNIEIERQRLDTKEKWDAYKNKVNQDFKDWQEKTQNDWEKGLKTFRKGFLKAYLWILLLVIPIIVIVVVIIRLTGI